MAPGQTFDTSRVFSTGSHKESDSNFMGADFPYLQVHPSPHLNLPIFNMSQIKIIARFATMLPLRSEKFHKKQG